MLDVKYHKNGVSFPGTNPRQIGDLKADIMSIFPGFLHGFEVSLGPLMQYSEQQNKILNIYMNKNEILISGHSLGGGIAILCALDFLESGYKGVIRLQTQGALKVLSKAARDRMEMYRKGGRLKINYRQNYRDPVPKIGYWWPPKHNTPKEGDKPWFQLIGLIGAFPVAIGYDLDLTGAHCDY